MENDELKGHQIETREKIKQNYVLEKLSAAGIEVITDKEEFDRILARENMFQKMAKSKSDKYLNTEDIKILKNMGYKKDDFERIQRAILASDIKLNDKKVSVKKAVEVLGRDDFLSGIARSAFHWSAERINGNNSVSFDSSVMFRHSISEEEKTLLNNATKQANEHIDILNELVRQESYFTFDEEDSKKFVEHIDEWQKDKTNPSKLIVVGKVTPIMKILGISEKLIEVEQSTLDKMLREAPLYPNDKQGHKLTVDDIYAIPSQLADPVMVFKSRSRDDSYVFFTERKDSENHSILIPLAVDKRKGRIVIHEITSMYGKDNEIDFVKTNINENNLIYEDRKRSCSWAKEKVEELNELNRKDAEKKLSPNGERFTQIQFLGQRFTDNGTYTFNILTKERLVNFLSFQNPKVQNFIQDNTTYGFAYNGKIYLNPDVMNSEVAVHEYTHLWDNYTQKTNPELWNKGLNIFKGTSLWNEVINDESYADIKNDENLVLSECHARICGKIADAILDKILEQDGKFTADKVIDWDKECSDYIYKSLHISVNQKIDKDGSLSFVDLQDFLSQPMKDLMKGIQITKTNENGKENMDEIIDKEIEQIQVNHGLSDAEIEADIKALENPKPDYLDDKGNPHWYDEEEDKEEYDNGQIPLEVVDRFSQRYFNSDKVSTHEYIIRIDEGLFKELAPEKYKETSFSNDEIPAITYRQSTNPNIPDQFLISKYHINKYYQPLIQKTIEINDNELLRQIKLNVEDFEKNEKQFDKLNLADTQYFEDYLKKNNLESDFDQKSQTFKPIAVFECKGENEHRFYIANEITQKHNGNISYGTHLFNENGLNSGHYELINTEHDAIKDAYKRAENFCKEWNSKITEKINVVNSENKKKENIIDKIVKEEAIGKKTERLIYKPEVGVINYEEQYKNVKNENDFLKKQMKQFSKNVISTIENKESKEKAFLIQFKEMTKDLSEEQKAGLFDKAIKSIEANIENIKQNENTNINENEKGRGRK